MKAVHKNVPLTHLESQLHTLDRRIEGAEFLDQKARIMNLAGDLCFDAGQPERALAYYESAINTYAAGAHYDSAALICKKIVALTPEAIRGYSRLAWLAVVRGMLEEARDRIGDYARAAEATGLGREARGELLGMAEMSDASEVLESIGEALLHLDDSVSADAVFGRMRGTVSTS